MDTHYFKNPRQFEEKAVTRWLMQYQNRPRRHFHLDWHLVARYLRDDHHLELLEVFKTLVKQKQTENRGFSSVEFVFDVLKNEWGITLPQFYLDVLRGTITPDYPALMATPPNTTG
jgi:hypothetical protein